MDAKQITPDEVCAIIDLATEKWHEVAKSHRGTHCNCFREEFGKALIERCHFSEEEMVSAWEARRHLWHGID